MQVVGQDSQPQGALRRHRPRLRRAAARDRVRARRASTSIGIDVDRARSTRINAGQSYIVDVQRRGDRAAGRGRPPHARPTDFAVLAELDTINICVPTPLRKTKDPDMSFIVAAVAEIAQYLRPGQLVDPREHDLSGHDRRGRAAGARGGGPRGRPDFFLAFSPERDRSGQQAATTRATSRRSSAASRPRCTEVAAGALRAVHRHGRAGVVDRASPRW